MIDLDEEVLELIHRLGINALYKDRNGHMGVVVVGTHGSYGKVILKLLAKRLRQNPIFYERWKRELFATTILSNYTEVPKILISGRQPYPWFVQRFVGESTLDRYIQDQTFPLKPLAHLSMVRILDRLLRIVKVSTKKKFIHRDIRPANIVLSEDLQPYLIDWGLVSLAPSLEIINGDFESQELVDSTFGERLTEPSRCHGVIGYIPPEQATAYFDVPSVKNDLYSLALIAIESLTGRSLFAHINHEDGILDAQISITKADDLEALHTTIWTLFDANLFTFLLPDPKRRNTDIEQLRHIIWSTLSPFSRQK